MPPRKHVNGICTCATHVPRPWNRAEHWTAAEVEYLETWYGRRTDALIAKKLGRSVEGLHLKARRLGLRKRDAGMTGREVAAIFGIDSGTIGKTWIKRGLLRASRAAYWQGPYPVHIVDPADVERFIREHPEYVDVAKMPDSPYRDMAARDPWISLPEVHRLTGRNNHAVADLVAAGVIRGRRRGTHWYIPLADVAKIRALQPDHIEESRFRRESVLEARRNRRKLRTAA